MSGIEVSAKSVGPPHFPDSGASADLRALHGPRFVVTVDTEEEFDWSAPFSRDRHGLKHLAQIGRFQALCESHRVKPTYLVDYPVAADDFAAELFAGLAKAESAEIGLQLHPWVTPPFDEEVSARNSYACNLPAPLERDKLQRLHDLVTSRMDALPLCYRAGRYGAGANTPAILGDLGIRIDSSVRARFDYRRQGGPDFSGHAAMPYWVEPQGLLELPLTTVFAGVARTAGPMLFSKAFESEAMRAFLARSGMLERLSLTPEGIPVDKAIKAIDLALDEKLPVLVFSFHSPSLAPGNTPYVRNEAEVESFYSWWSEIFGHLQSRAVAPVAMSEIAAAAFD